MNMELRKKGGRGEKYVGKGWSAYKRADRRNLQMS